MIRLIRTWKQQLRTLISDEERRMRAQFLTVFAILSVVSLFMTAVNWFTGKTLLMYATLVFGVCCAIDHVLALKSERLRRLSIVLFIPEILGLFVFFIVSGEPEGFSAIWCAMLPASGLLLFRKKGGSVLSLSMLLILVFFFWTAPGRSLLHYRYTDSFMLRFPLLYIAFFAIALFLEMIRSVTFENYYLSSRHDPLTGALNRAGFKDHIEKQIRANPGYCVGFVIFDLDHFKRINDTYGHFCGDDVLKETCRRLQDLTGHPICRWGGEEFAMIEPTGRLSQSWADTVIAGYSAKPFTLNGETVTLTISLGAVTADRGDSISPDKLCIEADKCLYEAKENGRNRGVYRKIGTASLTEEVPEQV